MPLSSSSGDQVGTKTLFAGSLLRFFSLTYGLTWTCFFAAVAVSGSFGSFVPALSGFRTPLLIFGTFAPSLVALGLTARDDRIPGTHALLHRLFEARAAARWYLFAVVYMPTIKLSVAVVSRLITGSWPLFGNGTWYVIAVAIVVSTLVQAGEEIGWRGYALPRLAVRLGLARASLFLGFIWACWHLPLFFLPGMDKYGQSFPMFVLGGIALSVAIAWLYANTRGSLLLAMLMHSAVNQAVGIVPSAVANSANPFALSTSLVAGLTDAFLWITAVYFLVRMRHIKWSGVDTQPAIGSGAA